MPLYRRTDSGPWWYRFKVQSREYRGTTGEADRRKAEIVERRKRAEVERSNPRKRKRGRTLADVAGLDTERALNDGNAPTRIPTLEHQWGWIVRILGDLDPETVSAEMLARYVSARRGRGVRGQTIRRELQTLRRGLRIAYKRGWVSRQIDADDWPSMRTQPQSESKTGKLHDAAVLRTWLQALHNDARDEAVFVLLTGLRSHEVKRLCPSWVRPAPKSAGVPALLRVPAEAAKTRTERTVGLVDAALEILERRAGAIAEGRDPRDVAALPLFGPDYKKARERACRSIGYPINITLRDLRHCHLTWGLEGTGDLRGVLAAGGHSDTRTALRYQHSTLTRTASIARAVADAVAETSGTPAVAHKEEALDIASEDAA